jgi:hypothetical protein
MVVLEDFTRISAIHTGYVECCPRCGRAGIEQHSADREPVVVHSEISEVLGDGMRVEPQDCCAVPRT